MNKELTNHEKLILYNMVHDRYYSLIMQNVSKEIRKEYLDEWEEVLKDILTKMKLMGWNGYE